MAINEDELAQIKAQVSQLEKYFLKEIAYLKTKIGEIESQLKTKDVKVDVTAKTDHSYKDILEVLKQFQEREKSKIKQGIVEQKPTLQEEKLADMESLQTPKEKVQQEYQQSTKEKKPSWEIPAFITELFVPLAEFRDLFISTYQHYKTQNRLPVFFMTLGGAVAILLGFIYLMQFIPEVYFEAFKVGGSFLASFAILFGGLVLLKKEEKYHEFGSALLGLSIAINFLILYYLSGSATFPVFANPMVSFALTLLNTAFAKWLALQYETKIVLTISFLGGVFSPFYLNTSAIPIFYFVYLWSLCIAAIFVASKIKWQIGDFLVFITASIALQIAFSQLRDDFSILAYTLIVHGFAYVFFYVSLFKNRIPKENLERLSVAILAGAGSLLLYQLFWFYEALGQRWGLGLVYLGNAVLFLASYFALRKQLSKKMQVLFFIITGTFTALSVPVMLERNVAGIFWAMEAIALIFCGFNFNLSGVRKEGYIILVIALGQIFFSLSEIIDNWGIHLWTDGFINLLSLGAVFGILKVLFIRYKADYHQDNPSNFLEKNINYWLSESLPFWLALVMWIPCYFQFRELTFNLAILGLYGFTWWGLKNKLVVTEWVGILHIGLIILGIIESILAVNSFIFPFQTPLGKVAMIEVFISLWLLQFFYEKINPQARNILLMRMMREIFYLLVPLLHLSYINRFYSEYLLIALWVTVLVGFILNEFVKRKALLLEIHLFTIAATLGIFTALGNLLIGYLSAISGLVVLFGILIYKKGFLVEIAKTSKYRLLFTYSFYYLGLCLWLYYLVLTSANFLQVPDVSGTFFVIGLYYLLLTYFKNNIAPLQSNKLFAFRVGMLAGLIGLLIAFIDKELMIDLYDSEYEIMSFVLMLSMVTVFSLITYQMTHRYPSQNPTLWKIDLFFTHIFIALAYSSLIGYFTPNWTGVWLTVILVLHAIILLFNSNSPIYKSVLRLSIAYFAIAFVKLFWRDMAGFETIQKVVVFMVIGILMLAGSYLFMRFREKSR